MVKILRDCVRFCVIIRRLHPLFICLVSLCFECRHNSRPMHTQSILRILLKFEPWFYILNYIFNIFIFPFENKDKKSNIQRISIIQLTLVLKNSFMATIWHWNGNILRKAYPINVLSFVLHCLCHTHSMK